MKRMLKNICVLLLLTGCLVPPAPIYQEYIKSDHQINNIEDLDVDFESFVLRSLPKNNYDAISVLKFKNNSNNEKIIKNYSFRIDATNNVNFKINSVSKVSCDKKDVQKLKDSILFFKERKVNLKLSPDETVCLYITHVINDSEFTYSDFMNLDEINYLIGLEGKKNQFVFNKIE